MSLNATLLIQMTVFAVVVLFSMKFIWPMIMEAIEERNKSISDGLAAAEQGQNVSLVRSPPCAELHGA